MQRRQVLAGAAGCLVTGIAAAPASLPATIIDTHVHFYDPSRAQGVPWPPKDNKVLYRPVLPREMTQFARPLGVTGAIVVEASPWVEDNRWLLDLAATEPFIVGVVGNIEPAQPAFRVHLTQLRKDRKFRGIRIGSVLTRNPSVLTPNSEWINDIKRLADAGLTLDVIGGPVLLPLVVQLSDLVPSLKIVIDHLPFDPPQEQAAREDYEKALRELGRRPHVFAKVSNVLRRKEGTISSRLADYKPQLDELWQVFGPDRVVYGSNWPVSDLIAPYPTVFQVVQEYVIAKSSEAAEKYFFRNAQAAYGLVVK